MAAHFRGNVLAGNTLYIDPVSGFITALLPVLKEKVDSVILGIANDPKLLSKFIKQLLNFDETTRDSFSYDGGNLELGWKGLTWEVLDSWFARWLEAEKDFALQSTRFYASPSIERLSEVSVPLISNFLPPLSNCWNAWNPLTAAQSSTSAEQLIEFIDPPIF